MTLSTTSKAKRIEKKKKLSSLGAFSFFGGRDCNRVGLLEPPAAAAAPVLEAAPAAGPVAGMEAHMGCSPGET